MRAIDHAVELSSCRFTTTYDTSMPGLSSRWRWRTALISPNRPQIKERSQLSIVVLIISAVRVSMTDRSDTEVPCCSRHRPPDYPGSIDSRKGDSHEWHSD